MKKILVLEGGFNEEHEISLNTSKEVQKSLKRMKFKFEVLQVNPVNFSEKIEFMMIMFYVLMHYMELMARMELFKKF